MGSAAGVRLRRPDADAELLVALGSTSAQTLSASPLPGLENHIQNARSPQRWRRSAALVRSHGRLRPSRIGSRQPPHIVEPHGPVVELLDAHVEVLVVGRRRMVVQVPVHVNGSVRHPLQRHVREHERRGLRGRRRR